MTDDLGPTALVPQSYWYSDPHEYIIAEGVGPTHIDDPLVTGKCKSDGLETSLQHGPGTGPPGHHCHRTPEYHANVCAGTVVIMQ